MPVRLEKMGECILRLRKERGYSLEELAGLILSSPDELRKIESGTQQPDKMTLTLLSNVLNVYPDSLQNGEIHYRASQSNLINLMKETLKYLEGTEEDNKEIAEHIEKMQKEYDIQQEEKQEEEKTEHLWDADILAATSSLQMGREPVQSKQNAPSRPVCGGAF